MRSNRLGLAMILVSGFAGAQGPPSVRAAGEGVVYAKPDEARIDIAVVTQAPTAQEAGAQNAARIQAVLERLRRVLGSKADIQTISYSLNPDYQFNQGKRILKGYNAVNTVEITSNDLAGLGKVIDAATQAGADQVQRLQYVLKDQRAALAEALRKATAEARSNAAAMASALGLKLGRVLLLEQSGAEPAQPMPVMATVAETVTPLENQTIEVRASVTLTMAVE